jgi:hypothetical protein
VRISFQKSKGSAGKRWAVALLVAAGLVAAAATTLGELAVTAEHGHGAGEAAAQPAQIHHAAPTEPGHGDAAASDHGAAAGTGQADAADQGVNVGEVASVLLISVSAAALAVLAIFAAARGSPSRGALGDLRIGVALLSVGAAIVHFAVISEHLEEWWLEGAFFAAVGVLQLGWAFVISLAPSPRAYIAGAIGNGLVAVTWLVSRTTGIPVGPDAGTPEPVGFPDALVTAFEVALVCVVAVLLSGRARGEPRVLPPARSHSWGLAGIVATLTGLSLLVLAGL